MIISANLTENKSCEYDSKKLFHTKIKNENYMEE